MTKAEEAQENFQKRMRELKKKYGTAEALGEKLGLSRDAVYSYIKEKDPKKASFETICQVCEKLNVTPDWLLGFEENADAFPLSYEARECVKTCGRSIVGQDMEYDYENNPYQEKDYYQLREILDTLLQEKDFYRAIRQVYSAIQFEVKVKHLGVEKTPGRLEPALMSELMIEAAARMFAKAAEDIIKIRASVIYPSMF